MRVQNWGDYTIYYTAQKTMLYHTVVLESRVRCLHPPRALGHGLETSCYSQVSFEPSCVSAALNCSRPHPREELHLSGFYIFYASEHHYGKLVNKDWGLSKIKVSSNEITLLILDTVGDIHKFALILAICPEGDSAARAKSAPQIARYKIVDASEQSGFGDIGRAFGWSHGSPHQPPMQHDDQHGAPIVRQQFPDCLVGSWLEGGGWRASALPTKPPSAP